jgi:hypothetical protein
VAWAVRSFSLVDVVIAAFSFCGELRGHAMNHSATIGKQANCRNRTEAIKRRWHRCAATVGKRSWHLMAGHGAKLPRKQEEAVAALLSQRNIEDAARIAGVGTRTLLRWLKLPEFQATYRQARRAAFGQSIARLQQASSAAVAALLKVLVDPNTPASSRVRAADCVLDHAAKAIEIEDIEVRVTQLEQAAEASKSGWMG